MDHAVARLARFALEQRRDDDQLEMPATAFGTGVSGVFLAVVDQFDAVRRQHRQLLLNAVERIFHLAGSSSICLASINACRTAKTSISPMPPNSLKLTHVSVG